MRRNGSWKRGREGRKAGGRMLEDGAVGADHRLNAGYPVNGPEKENTRALREDHRVNVNKEEEKCTLWVLYTGPCSQDLKKTHKQECC